MATQKERPETSIVTDKVRASYAHVFEPYAAEEGKEKKFSVSLIIPKSNKALVKRINVAIDAAKEIAKSKLGGKLPPIFKLPLRDGDTDRPEDEAYANCYFLNATTKRRPQVIDLKGNHLMTEEDFYSGCYCRASVNFYYFNKSGNKGIACGLNNLQFVEHGDALAGVPSASDDFGIEQEEDI